MNWSIAAEEIVSCSVSGFYSGVDVWLTRPQVLNRRLLGCVEVYASGSTTHATGNGDREEAVSRYRELLNACEVGDNSRVLVRQLLPRLKNMAESLEGVIIGRLICCAFLICSNYRTSYIREVQKKVYTSPGVLVL